MNIIAEAKAKNLATDLILVAARDLKNPKFALESALWFVGPDFGFWSEVAGIPLVDPLAVFRQLKPRNARVLLFQVKRVVGGYVSHEYYLGAESGYVRRDVVRLEKLVASTLEGIVGGVKVRKDKGTKRKVDRPYWRRNQEAEHHGNI
jgi:hypothetical protein